MYIYIYNKELDCLKIQDRKYTRKKELTKFTNITSSVCHKHIGMSNRQVLKERYVRSRGTYTDGYVKLTKFTGILNR